MVPKSVRLFIWLSFLGSLLYGTPLKGQDKDAGLWTSVSFEAKIIKKLTGSLSQEIRFNENITEAGTIFTDAGIAYKLNKHFQVSLNYRYILKRRTDDYYSFRQGFYVDVKYDRKLNPFELIWRVRFTDRYSDIGRAADGGVPEYYLRNKLSLKWDYSKAITPYASVELFSPLNYPRFNAFNNIRLAAGIEYSISKHHKIDLYYMVQKELNVSHPQTDFILGLGYAYKL